jgi:hypothetical protein
MTISGSSVMTALAAAFMRSSARRSFGFSKEYLFENLRFISTWTRKIGKGLSLMESSAINADSDPRVRQEQIRLLERFHVFISTFV